LIDETRDWNSFIIFLFIFHGINQATVSQAFDLCLCLHSKLLAGVEGFFNHIPCFTAGCKSYIQFFFRTKIVCNWKSEFQVTVNMWKKL
jgi:hypothetical protein